MTFTFPFTCKLRNGETATVLGYTENFTGMIGYFCGSAGQSYVTRTA